MYFFVLTGHAQESTIDIQNITKVTVFQLGISHEHRVGKLQSLYLQPYMKSGVSFSYSSSFGTKSYVFSDPAITAQYRYYYNAARRLTKGKQTNRNNLNYIAAYSEAVFYHEKSTGWRTIYTIGPVWGIQRNYESRFSLDFNLGTGFYFGKGWIESFNDLPRIGNVSGFDLILQINIGFWLGSKRK
ncbi:MAG TPA: hypothetical protein VM012_01930 [Flavitalea sp.]|nr:hypothetical protein [Flavitalea sp.]